MDASGVNFIDCIKVYTRTKAVFGWPEDPPPPLPTPSKGEQKAGAQGAEPEEEGSNLSMVISTKTVSPADKLVRLANFFGDHHLVSLLSSLTVWSVIHLMY